MNSTTEPNTFNDLLPRLIDEYSLPRGELTPTHPLADQTNRLTPTFAALSDRIWTTLPSTDFSSVSDHSELARSFTGSADVLAAKQKEVRNFAESICIEAVDLRVRGQHVPQAKAAALRSAREPLCRAVQQVNRPLEPVLTADLIAQPLNEITPVLNNWLRQSSFTVAAQLLLSMHVLVELDVVGLIEWPGETACKLNFFRHCVTQDQLRNRQTEKIEADGLWTRFETWEQFEGRNQYSIERHEHHVMNAEARRLNEVQHPIPEDKQAFLNKVPGWIRQHMRVLEGDLILERVIERKIRDEQWKTTPVLRSSYELDPAILLGHYVVTGWGQQDVNRERFRRKRITNQSQMQPPDDDRKSRAAAGKTFNSLRPWTVATAAGATALMLFSRLQPAAMVPLALLLTIVFIVISVRCIIYFSRWKHATVDWLFVVAAAASAAGGLLAVQSLLYGIMFGRWSLIGSAILLGLISQVASGISRSRQGG